MHPPTHYVSKRKHLNKLTHLLFWLVIFERPKKSGRKNQKQKETNFIGTKVTQKLKNSKKDKMQKKPERNLGS